MITKTITVHEGEYLGAIDWNYDFLSHFNCLCSDDKGKIEYCEQKKEMLKKLEQNPGKYQATTDGGWPRCGWEDVLQVGMYDGWPYWKPVPSVCLKSWMGGSWHSFGMITSIREKKEAK